MAILFSPLTIREVELPNRIAVSPMQQYCAMDGRASDWHLVHLGSRAVGGAGLVTVEATAISREGRWTPHDLGIWSDELVPGLARLANFIQDQGAIPAIQIGHAGAKGSRRHPREGFTHLPAREGGWEVVSSSAVPALPGFPIPHELSQAEISRIVTQFQEAADRADRAGFQVLELHGAHGYLIHQFLSPAMNHRQDGYGGSLENRLRFLQEIVQAVRWVWPDHKPLALRISAVDFIDHPPHWTLDDSVELGKRVKSWGVDWIAASGGGFARPTADQTGPGFQVPFAERIRKEADILTQAVGEITHPQQAESILQQGRADLIALGREMLREPYWAIRAARKLGVEAPLPEPYLRAF